MTQDLFCVSFVLSYINIKPLFRLKENEKEKKNDNKSWANKSAVSFSLGFFCYFQEEKKPNLLSFDLLYLFACSKNLKKET